MHRNLAQQATLDALYDHLPVAWNTADQAMARGETISLLTVADVWKAADGFGAVCKLLRRWRSWWQTCSVGAKKHRVRRI